MDPVEFAIVTDNMPPTVKKEFKDILIQYDKYSQLIHELYSIIIMGTTYSLVIMYNEHSPAALKILTEIADFMDGWGWITEHLDNRIRIAQVK